ncbi:hypothetical protein TNIN_79921 [Trichonephila inaurata madagascariensis]|uniref:Uncharacterized protein n=1 Tax=Trichonephila inaurata madagascariensis TaxID=2747483 RepID=A0A8X6YQ64_9ARAC|nr:hypothetical protein TNIN_79921 [Trichonephila inaurata madagascariensis]
MAIVPIGVASNKSVSGRVKHSLEMKAKSSATIEGSEFDNCLGKRLKILKLQLEPLSTFILFSNVGAKRPFYRHLQFFTLKSYSCSSQLEKSISDF